MLQHLSNPRAPAAPAVSLRACATLAEYERFHGMLIAPGPAQRCVESFNGRILFMPSSYSRDAATFPAAGLRSRLEPSLTLTTYYLLVLASLTGLSTLLGQTDVLARYNFGRPPDARVLPDDANGSEERQRALSSAVTPALRVDPIVLDYLTAPAPSSGATAPKASVRLKRRFEYHFKLAGVRVAMLHFVSVNSDGKPLVDAQSREILHLVEVYETEWGMLPHPAVAVLGGLVFVSAAAVSLLLRVF